VTQYYMGCILRAEFQVHFCSLFQLRYLLFTLTTLCVSLAWQTGNHFLL